MGFSIAQGTTYPACNSISLVRMLPLLDISFWLLMAYAIDGTRVDSHFGIPYAKYSHPYLMHASRKKIHADSNYIRQKILVCRIRPERRPAVFSPTVASVVKAHRRL